MLVPNKVDSIVKSGDIRLNLGSGVDYREGYINVDLDPSVHPDLLMDFSELENVLAPSSVSEVIMMHSLNYLTLWQARALFRMMRRLLRPDGVLVMETVNLDSAIEKVRSSVGCLEQHLEGVRAFHAFGIDQVERCEIYHPNKFSWAPWHLEQELRDAGWTEINKLEPHTHSPWRDMRFECRLNSVEDTVFMTTSNEKQSPPIRVLILHDAPGWAWWHRAHQIKKNINSRFQVDIKALYDPVHADDYDLFLVFDAYVTDDPRWNLPAQKTIVGCSCPKLIEDTIRRVEQQRFLGSIVNNYNTYLRAIHREDFFCCENGVDTELFFPAKTPINDFVACWVGNSRSMGNKGLDIMLKACSEIGMELRYIDKQAGHGVVIYDQEDLRDELYHKSSFYLCASEFEGTPNPVLEALACGLPVVTTPVGNTPELIRSGYNGEIVERSVESIKGGIRKLQEVSLASLRQHARYSVTLGWTWKDKIINYESAFVELYNRSQKRRW